MRTAARFGAIVLLVGFASSQTASGQGACGCDAVLLDGVYSLRVERGDSDAQKSMAQHFATMSHAEFKASSGGGGGLAIAGFGLDFGMSKTQFEKRQQELVQKFKSDSSKVTSDHLVKKYGDPAVLGAWSECKKNCSQNGVRWWTETYDENHIGLAIFLESPNPLKPTWPIRGSEISGGTVTIRNPPPGMVFPENTILQPNKTAIRIARDDPNQPVVVTIQFDGLEDVYAVIPRFIAPLPKPRTLRDRCGADEDVAACEDLSSEVAQSCIAAPQSDAQLQETVKCQREAQCLQNRVGFLKRKATYCPGPNCQQLLSKVSMKSCSGNRN